MGAYLDRALILLQQGRPDLAERELRQELALEPESGPAHTVLSLCLLGKDRYEEATTEAEEGIRLAPDFPLAYYALGQILLERNRPDEAERATRRALELNPTNASYHGLLARIHIDRRMWQEALEAAEQGLHFDPEHVDCNNYRAMALVKLGRRQEAGATIASALAKDPEDAFTHANQGWTLLEQGQPEQAMHHFREALRLNPEMEWARAGIVEALKARFLVYRLMLQYFFWMSRLSGRARWGIILGGYFGYRALQRVARNNADLAPWIWPLLFAYVIFVLMTWLSSPLFNLLLRLNRFGRLALSREQIVASNWIGSSLGLALVCLAVFLLTASEDALHGAVFFGLLVIPIAGTFKCSVGWPRHVMIVYTLVMALAGLAAFALLHFDSPAFGLPAAVFLLGAVFSSWAGVILAQFEVKR